MRPGTIYMDVDRSSNLYFLTGFMLALAKVAVVALESTSSADG